MIIPSLPRAARPFRAERVPVPGGAANEAAAARLARAVAAGGPIDLEIGCGVGWHPIRYAVENPERALVAIERTAEKFEKFRERLARHPEQENLIAVHADAIAWVTHFVPPGSLDRVFLYYPNPNVQNPQARWIRMPFFGALITKLKPGGSLEFRTNLPEYADEILRYFPTWGMELCSQSRLSTGAVVDARTHFERKYLARGETCFSVILGTLR